jgi:hypothetical protein
MMTLKATVANKPGHRGEREISVKTIARGMPGCLGCTCGDCRLLFFCRRAMGAASARHSLRPLSVEGHIDDKTRACGAARPTTHVFHSVSAGRGNQ